MRVVAGVIFQVPLESERIEHLACAFADTEPVGFQFLLRRALGFDPLDLVLFDLFDPMGDLFEREFFAWHGYGLYRLMVNLGAVGLLSGD